MLKEFYRDILPTQGHYALFLGTTKQHIWCETLDELTRQTEERADVANLYYAVNSFRSQRRLADNALLSRAFYFDIDAGPAKYAKHVERVYPTRAEALAAVVQWCTQAGLVPSRVVASGAGLHVYFVLDEDTPIALWHPVAEALKAMALAQGLRIDPAVTADAARVLRPVGSLHSCGATVRDLKVLGVRYALDDIRERVAAYLAPPPRAKRERGINDDILEAPSGPPKSVEKIGARCAAMNHAMRCRGDVSEPYWRAMLGIIKHTVEGVAAAHDYSIGHPDYTPEATEEKFNRWNAGPTSCATFEAENPEACGGCKWRGKIKSPIRLGELEPPEIERMGLTTALAAPEPTAGDPELQAILDGDGEPATPTPVGDPWAEHLPDGFRVAPARGGFVMIHRHRIPTVNEAGDKVEIEVDTPFAAVPFWFESWAPGTSKSDQAQAVYCAWDAQRRRVERFTLPTRDVARKDTLLASLAEQNIQVYPSTNNARAAMEDFVKASLERIRSAGQRPKIHARFGTMFNADGALVVAQGRHLIHADGSIMEGVLQDRLRGRSNSYSVPVPDDPRGVWGADVWETHIFPRAQRHIEYLKEYYAAPNFRPFQLAIMLSWASPMMAFMTGGYHPGMKLPGSGLTVTLYSPKSGIGKTAAMHAAALAFGDPASVCLQLDRSNSTDFARIELLAQSGTLPAYMDEMEDVPAQTLASLISSIGNGATRQRMNKDLAITGGETIALVNLMSTNKSHREITSADRNESAAVQNRLLEIECSDVEPVSPERASQATRDRAALHDCAGAIGAIIHREMARQGAAKLAKLGLECADEARRLLDASQEGRLVWRAFGAVLAVRRMLKSVGLKVFELNDLAPEFKRWYLAGEEFASEQLMPTDAGQVMAMMLSDLAGNTLVTQTENHNRGLSAKLDIPLNEHVPNVVVARSVLGAQCVYVKTAVVKDWCIKRGISPNILLRRARLAGILDLSGAGPRGVSYQLDLFKGTKLAQGVRDRVVKVWTSRLPTEVAPPRVPDNVVPLRPAVESMIEPGFERPPHPGPSARNPAPQRTTDPSSGCT